MNANTDLKDPPMGMSSTTRLLGAPISPTLTRMKNVQQLSKSEPAAQGIIDKDGGNRIFYPKKLHAFVNNILTMPMMNSAVFARWWTQTPTSKDFWIETATSFVRAHVVPRKGFFVPSNWQTSLSHTKHKLLQAIGCLRSTEEGVVCNILHALQPVHDTWCYG